MSERVKRIIPIDALDDVDKSRHLMSMQFLLPSLARLLLLSIQMIFPAQTVKGNSAFYVVSFFPFTNDSAVWHRIMLQSRSPSLFIF